MSKRNLIISLVAILGLGSLCFHLNRDLFHDPPIQIKYRVSPWLTAARPSRRGEGPGNPVSFSLDRHRRLSSVKVFVAQEIETNKYAHPLWHLTSDSNSVPVGSFNYGAPLRGMRPAVKNARPDPLQPGVTYRLLVQSGQKTAQLDFTTTPKQ